MSTLNTSITNVSAETIKDSRGVDTLKVTVSVGKISDSFSVPSGASTGKYEAHELRDDGTSHGGVTQALEIIENDIKKALVGMDVTDQRDIDTRLCMLDGTRHKTIFGGNSMIGISIACAKVAAKVKGVELYKYLRTLDLDLKPSLNKTPYLYINLINGGKHAASPLVFQEYHLVPDVGTLEEAISIGLEVQKELKNIIEKTSDIKYGDEGGFVINETDVFKPLDLLMQAIKNTNHKGKCFVALDVAASSFYDEKENVYNVGSQKLNKDQMIALYKKIAKGYPLLSIEDPFHEEDFTAFSELQSQMRHIRIIGDDLTVTNVIRLEKAVEQKSVTGIIIKPNQIGTLTETIDTMKFARNNRIDCVVSHRSGETMDNFIADLAYAFNAFGIKAGAFGPKEREAKYSRLKEISKELANASKQ